MCSATAARWSPAANAIRYQAKPLADKLMPSGEVAGAAAPAVADAAFDSPNARTKRGVNTLTGASLLGG